MLAFYFIFGTIIGSFFNVVILRKNTGESIIKNGSRCFSCGKKLGPLEMIPVFSFLWQKGKCKHCGSKISWQYPAIELLTGFLALMVYFKTGISFWWLFYFSALGALLLTALYDLRAKIIDRHFLYIFGVFAFIDFFFRKNFFSDLISSFFIALFFYLIWRFSGGRWMGRGDADLAFFSALFLGWPQNLFMIFLAFWLGGILGAYLLIFKSKRFGLKSEIPFGPFLALAVFLVWYFSDFSAVIYGIIF
ncbi:MAG: prepilin peptidase [Candidatus Giovannonibacteria bacterium]|nr:prepilin peptidase [Candidatus Giovannonibacteria bacterium]